MPIGSKGPKGTPRQIVRMNPGPLCQGAEVPDSCVEGGGQTAAAIVAAREHAFGTADQAPSQLERLARAGRCDQLEDCAALGVQVGHERLDLLPVQPRLRPRDAGQPPGDGARGLGAACASRQGQPQAPLGGSVSPADLDQEFRKLGCTERFQVCGVERLAGGHAVFCPRSDKSSTPSHFRNRSRGGLAGIGLSPDGKTIILVDAQRPQRMVVDTETDQPGAWIVPIRLRVTKSMTEANGSSLVSV